jgi:hypothetical protein
LYTTGDCRHLFVNLFLTLSSAFLILKDFRRKRLSGRLTLLKPAPTPDKYEEKDELDAIAVACAAAIRAFGRVNF